MNDIVYDINVEVEEVFKGIHPEAEEETISMLEEEVPLIHNLEEEGEERSVLDPPDVLSNEIEEEVSQTEETSIFEPQFEDVIETVEEENTEQDPVDLNEAESVTLSEEEEFIFNEVTNPLFKMDVIDPELVEAESQILLDFELPLQEKTSSELIATDDSKEETSEVSKLVEEDFEAAALEIKFEIKSEQEQADDVHTSTEELKSEGEDQINPFEQSIDKTIAAQTETRKAHLKAFNHQFSHQYQKVEDMEKEPAYKRKGLNLDDNLPEAPSRLSLDNDSNDDLQLRSNNSFLHDNVD
jgi:cell division protein FtsZ